MKNEEISEIKEQSIKDNTHAKILNFNLNKYAMECLTFGEIFLCDKIPFEEYVEKLKLNWFEPQQFRNKIAGIAINSEERIRLYTSDAIDYVFNFEANKLWSAATQDVPTCDDFELFDFDMGLAKYMNSLRPLFVQILSTYIPPIECYLDTDGDDAERNLDKLMIAKFLLGIKNKKIKPYQCVDKYICELSEIPYCIRKLIVEIKEEYYLREITANSLEYKLAILASFDFATQEHAYLFSKKLQRWEELYHKMLENIE